MSNIKRSVLAVLLALFMAVSGVQFAALFGEVNVRAAAETGAESEKTITGADMTLATGAMRGAIVLKELAGNCNAVFSEGSVTDTAGKTSVSITTSLQDVTDEVNYSSWQFAMSVRDANPRGSIINDGTSSEHGYIFMVENEWVMLFKHYKDGLQEYKVTSWNLEAGYSAAITKLGITLSDNADEALLQKRAAFYSMAHTWEFVAENQTDGSVKLYFMLDGEQYAPDQAYIDAEEPISTSTGFNFRTNGTYQFTITALSVNGTDILKDETARLVENAAFAYDANMLLLPSGITYQGLVSTAEQFTDIALETYLSVTDTYQNKGGWLTQFFFRDSEPGKAAYEKAADAKFYAIALEVSENRLTATLKRGNDAIGSPLTLSENCWAELQDFIPFGIVCEDNAETGAVDFTIKYDNDIKGVLSDTDAEKQIKDAGGFTIWQNTYTAPSGERGFYGRFSGFSLSGNTAASSAPDLSGCEQIDFTDMVKSTQDWQGQIREASSLGATKFTPNAMILTGTSTTKNAAFQREGFSQRDAVYNFKLGMTVNPDSPGGNWVLLINFRDSAPLKNTWDSADKNCYTLAVEVGGADQNRAASFTLKRVNNTSAGPTEKAFVSKGGLDLVTSDGAAETVLHDVQIASYNVENGVRIAIYYDGKLILDHTDTDAQAVTEGGTFAIVQNGPSGDGTILTKDAVFQGMAEGEYREDIVIGINEPSGEEGVELYPQDIYSEPELEDYTGTAGGCGSSVAASLVSLAGFAVLASVLLLIRHKKEEKE